MRILVLSDSHHGMSFMEECAEKRKPDCIIHLGDYYPDGFDLKQMFPKVLFYQVPGNCDAYTCREDIPLVLMPTIGGCRFFLTHGHRHGVKQGLGALLKDARASKASAVLYGHTHQADCRREPDGLWILNPGSCGYYGGSAGLMEIQNQQITSCRILREGDL